MANILKFEIATEASYTDEETVNLLDAFMDFIKKADEDVIDGTENLDIIEPGDDSDNISDEKKSEIVKEWLDNAKFTARVNIDGEDIGTEVTLKLS